MLSKGRVNIKKYSLRHLLVGTISIGLVVLMAIFSFSTYYYVKLSLSTKLENSFQAKWLQIAQNCEEGTTCSEEYFFTDDGARIFVKEFSKEELPSTLSIDSIVHRHKEGKELLINVKQINRRYIYMERDITTSMSVLEDLQMGLLLINAVVIALAFGYLYFISSLIASSIGHYSKKLSRMDENVLRKIKGDNFPKDFEPLVQAINSIINKISIFTKAKRELFIGVAHELKTPLAVMKLKNEVTLIKERNPKEYQEALKINIHSINELNNMISHMLRIGRLESDKFEPAVEMDLIEFLEQKAKDYQLLSKEYRVNFIYTLEPKSFKGHFTPILLNHIIQNFIQNAFKFSPKEATVTLRSYLEEQQMVIEVLDEGQGIEGDIDYFKAFERKGEKAGVGLGLFLAKNAADSIGASILLKNREGSKGAIAKLIVNRRCFCDIC